MRLDTCSYFLFVSKTSQMKRSKSPTPPVVLPWAWRRRGIAGYTVTHALQFYEPKDTPGYTGTPPHTCGTGHRWIMLVVIIMGRARGVCPCSFCTGGARRLAFG